MGVQGDLQIWWTPELPIIYVSNPKSGCSTIKNSLKQAQAAYYLRLAGRSISIVAPVSWFALLLAQHRAHALGANASVRRYAALKRAHRTAVEQAVPRTLELPEGHKLGIGVR